MGDHIQRHGRVHLAFGVALEDGPSHSRHQKCRQQEHPPDLRLRPVNWLARPAAKNKPDEMTGST